MLSPDEYQTSAQQYCGRKHPHRSIFRPLNAALFIYALGRGVSSAVDAAEGAGTIYSEGEERASETTQGSAVVLRLESIWD